MSAAKAKMREKKMMNQPASVQYPSGVNGEGGSQNRGHGSGGAFARARAAEVKAMLRAVSQTACSSHVFQALPKHMRRRAMSHNTKRLPRRLRDVADRMREKSLQAGSKKKKEPAKSKSRKARRRHGNLLLEFNRRQRKNIWLETHIWHAKRFHMVKKWGYCLGDRPTYKCYRSCYRAMSSYCLLQDLSYYCCIELKGEEDELLAALSQMTSKEAGPTFAAALCLSGRRQVSVTVYRAGQYPCQALGPVTVLWRPKTPGIRGRQLWIWAHPTLKQDLLPELQSVCRCWEAVPPSVDPEVSCGKEKSAPHPEPENVLEAKLKPGAKRKRSSVDASEPPVKKILGDGTRLPGTPVTWKSSSTGIVINDLTMEIVRYRLIGPQSHSVLTEALEAATVCKEVDKSLGSAFWWPQHCSDESNMLLHQQQADVFHTLKGISSTTELPPGTVLGLTVDDPRLTLPTKKMKVLPCVSQAQEADEDKRKELILRGVPEQCCQSSLWEESVRDDVTENKIPEQVTSEAS
uniref:Processing of 1, ribonuclease P/MRP subunit n=1 Tax=Nothobranchius rachovii TaxID=451742 RepID=A0A1A8RGE0_9TELE